jgi:hypothetical protein
MTLVEYYEKAKEWQNRYIARLHAIEIIKCTIKKM